MQAQYAAAKLVSIVTICSGAQRPLAEARDSQGSQRFCATLSEGGRVWMSGADASQVLGLVLQLRADPIHEIVQPHKAEALTMRCVAKSCRDR
jgi:hypothetical protein